MNKRENLTSKAVNGVDENLRAVVITDGKTPKFRDIQFVMGVITHNSVPDNRDSHFFTQTNDGSKIIRNGKVNCFRMSGKIEISK